MRNKITIHKLAAAFIITATNSNEITNYTNYHDEITDQLH